MTFFSTIWEKIKNTPKETLLLYVAGIVIIVLAVVMIYRDYQHSKELNSLYEQMSTVQKYNNGKNPVTYDLGNKNADAAGISTAGDISNNQSKEFATQIIKHEYAVSNGKAHDLYEYTTNTSAADTIKQIRSDISTGAAPKEVRHANFVTTSSTDDGTVTKVDEKTGEVTKIQQSTVKVNAYYNYQPSIYLATDASSNAFKRTELIYTNRDFMIGINYDNNRENGKIGAEVGYRIAKW
jgi:hypothetical protein